MAKDEAEAKATPHFYTLMEELLQHPLLLPGVLLFIQDNSLPCW